MKIRTLLFTLFFIFSFQVTSAQNLDQEINDLINSGDFLTLSRRYDIEKNNMQVPILKLLAEGFIFSSSNQPQKACEVFGELVTNHQENLGMNGITAMLNLIGQNLRFQGKYGEASDMMKSFLDQTAAFNGLDSITRASLQETLALGKLGNEPLIITRPDRDCEIPIVMGEDKLRKLPFVNVKLNGNVTPFIFDTGVDGHATNFVSEGFARKNSIHIIDDSVTVQGIAKGYVRLGVADSMQIGEITYKNVRFCIAPGDNILSVDSINVDAILGSVFIKAMGEIQFYPAKNKIVFPAKQTPIPETGSNMMLMNGEPYIEVYSDNERLLFHLDTGGGLGLSQAYYMRHKEEVESKGKLKTDGGLGGFGGMKTIVQYILPTVPIRLSNKTVKVNDMHVTAGLESNPIIDGSAGYDFVSLFDKFTINFDKMFVIGE